MTTSTPKPLPGPWLGQRAAREQRWEFNDRAGDKALREAQQWAKDRLIEIFIAQKIGASNEDPDFMDRVDEMYAAIRNAFTRQDLLRGFLLGVEKEAIQEADSQWEGFERELRDITGPEPV